MTPLPTTTATPPVGDTDRFARKVTHNSLKMAPLSVFRSALLVSFSVFLTVVLGVGLPALLNAAMRVLGLPETSATECIVMLYLLFVLYVATPRIPRGSVKVMFQYGPNFQHCNELVTHTGDGVLSCNTF